MTFEQEKEKKDTEPQVQPELENLKQENATLKQENQQLSERLKTLETRESERTQKEKDVELSAFCDGLIGQGKLLPAEKEEHLTILRILKNDEEHQFAEGKEKSGSPFEIYKKKLTDRPVNFVLNTKNLAEKTTQTETEPAQIELGGQVDEADLELFEAATELEKTEKISFATALEKVRNRRT